MLIAELTHVHNMRHIYMYVCMCRKTTKSRLNLHVSLTFQKFYFPLSIIFWISLAYHSFLLLYTLTHSEHLWFTGSVIHGLFLTSSTYRLVHFNIHSLPSWEHLRYTCMYTVKSTQTSTYMNNQVHSAPQAQKEREQRRKKEYTL